MQNAMRSYQEGRLAQQSEGGGGGRESFPEEVSKTRGASVAQSVKRLTSAQVMISQFVSSSPALGSVLAAQSLLRILSDSLSRHSPTCAVSVSLKINK